MSHKGETDRQCPVCTQPSAVDTVPRRTLPAMQNYLFRSADLARRAPRGELSLVACGYCGFGFNRSFDPSLLIYDECYDNLVPSRVMRAHYQSIAQHLGSRYLREDSLVVDVGCGKGSFLKEVTTTYPNTRCLGIDPSYTGDLQPHRNLRFIRQHFSSELIEAQPSVVVCRHVLEHLPDPVSFLATIRRAIEPYPDTPLFLEVPDTDWIIDNGAFWDLCYEHCNYFTQESLRVALQRAGFEAAESGRFFGDQYLWVDARISSSPATGRVPVVAATAATCERLATYAREEHARLAAAIQWLAELKAKGTRTALWGMATKGVLFCVLIDDQAQLVDYCIDINESKQGCFVPVTGHPILGPEALRETVGQPLTIVVMNVNYVAEISEAAQELGLKPSLVDAAGEPVSAGAAS